MRIASTPAAAVLQFAGSAFATSGATRMACFFAARIAFISSADGRKALWVMQLMGNYQRETGRSLRSHDFRRAAFTRAAAFDVTPETMLPYYTAMEKKKTSDEALGELADDLLPKPKAVRDEGE